MESLLSLQDSLRSSVQTRDIGGSQSQSQNLGLVWSVLPSAAFVQVKPLAVIVVACGVTEAQQLYGVESVSRLHPSGDEVRVHREPSSFGQRCDISGVFPQRRDFSRHDRDQCK